MRTFTIDNDRYSLETIKQVIDGELQLVLSENAKQRIIKCREYLDQKIENIDRPVYGITTGFGSLYDKTISKEDLGQLQENLVMSHACGTGDTVPQDIVRLMLLLKIIGLSYGHSGTRLDTVERLVDMYNHRVLPVVYQQGSLGASGDLAPLAHLSLPLIGLGEVWDGDQKRPAGDALREYNWEPLKLQSKEGLALLNGTQFMSAYATWCLLKARSLINWANTVAAVSLDAFDGRIEPFDQSVHQVRPHPGQLDTAKKIRALLDGSELISREKSHVQDPYSFRCIPQVHGASLDAITHIEQVVECEINSVTDNPTVFPDEDKVISAGNFHGQPLAINLDLLSIAMAEIGSISERRVYKLISGQRELPAFLVANPGLNSGFMIPQYTAASIASQNKQLCMPASIDTIDSSNGQEDHVSMGANAATKALRVVENVERILAIELMNASQALHFRMPQKTSKTLQQLVEDFREAVPFIEQDKVLYPEIEKSIAFIQSYSPGGK